ncbi:mechanosensitive ion channel family protein [Chitinophaga barathri]|uniref:Mechanosensitive ion channel protein n=1 Tax=Chitinophaga barathri TaxID=1647451 RepID=A0A3N4M4X0_9BACT|nr:mechanosensitive ion channel domain-containing protein [Chitinophaga barathri]RPD38204.1 mechanosensitive ion channel protein [Chitinophaga barathri]
MAKLYKRSYIFIGLLFLFLHGFLPLMAQDATDSTNTGNRAAPPVSIAQSVLDSLAGDTLRPKWIDDLQRFGEIEEVKSQREYKEGRISIRQNELLSLLKKTIGEAKLYLRDGIDTVGVARELEKSMAYFAIVKDGVFENKGSNQTQRNLSVSASILAELYKTMAHRQQTLNKYANDLIGFKDKLDSLNSDPVLYRFSSDSATTVHYVGRLLLTAREIVPADSSLKQAITRVQDLQLKLDPMVFTLRSALEDIERYRKDLSEKTFSREFNNIWGPVGYSRPFREILQFSWAKEKLAFSFYIRDYAGRFMLFFALLALCYLFIRALRRSILREGLHEGTSEAQLVTKYPLHSAILVVSGIFQFIFPSPPFVIACLFWLAPAISLCFIFSNYVTPYWMRFWITLILFFVLACVVNLVLQASRTERYIMLALAFAGAIYTAFVLMSKRKNELREKYILYFIGFVTVMEIASVLFNAFGRHNLAKTFLISGFAGVVIAILFLWTVRLLNQLLRLANVVYRHTDQKFQLLNFQKVGTEVPRFFYVLLVLGWFILVGRNFYSFRMLSDPLNSFLSRERTLGQYDFTINSLLIFTLILVCATLLSRIVSYFATETPTQGDAKKGRLAWGSWILLIRIFIICLGLFLAFAATGIPIDRITIILGALGVGVGLGLQSLVNNLVSGLIIAFEKPVNVGDIIEINGKSATMKSIGFRSSIVVSVDGACIIIPNGELLSQHLVNWSMNKNIKRVELDVGVAYGTNLEKVKTILTDILSDDDRIMPVPVPLVVARSFGDNSINFKMIFWVHNIREHLMVTSDIISKTDRAFTSSGIVIPFPQRDIHVRDMPTTPPAKPEA